MANDRDTLVVNIFGAPSSGKSTIATYLFSQLKMRGISCELVTEYAKDLVWEERDLTFLNEVYIFAKQHQRMFRVMGKVDVIVTDRPLLLSAYYNTRYGGNRFEKLNDLVIEQDRKHRNLDIFLTRTHTYEDSGRNENEKEANEIEQEMREFLLNENPNMKELKGRSMVDIQVMVEEVVDYILLADSRVQKIEEELE